MNKIFVDQIKRKGDVNKPGPGTYYQTFFAPPNKEKGEGEEEAQEGDDAKSNKS